MRTACKKYNNSAMSLVCTHAQENKRNQFEPEQGDHNHVELRKGNVSRPSDVQWVKVVQCTEPREVVLSGKL